MVPKQGMIPKKASDPRWRAACKQTKNKQTARVVLWGEEQKIQNALLSDEEQLLTTKPLLCSDE